MDLKESLLTAMKEALKAKNSLKLNTIRGLISEVKNREIDLRRDLENNEIISVVSSQIKKRKEASTLFDKGGRSDLSEKENQEIAFLQEYLPEPISEEDLRKRLKEVILELGVSDIKDLGKVMKIIIPEFKGRADNGQIKNLVAEYLRQ